QEWRDNRACGCDACVSLIEAFGLESSAEVVAEPQKVIDWNVRATAGEAAEALSSNPEAVAGVYRPDLLLKHVQRQGASGEEITAAAILSDQADNMERLALEMERWRQEAIRWEGEERKRASERDRMRAALERWSHDGRLQTFEDRERFRHEARELIGDRPAVETSAPQAPIAKVTVTDGDLATVELYAPG